MSLCHEYYFYFWFVAYNVKSIYIIYLDIESLIKCHLKLGIFMGKNLFKLGFIKVGFSMGRI